MANINPLSGMNANDGDILVYNAATGQWEPQAQSGGGGGWELIQFFDIFTIAGQASYQISNLSAYMEFILEAHVYDITATDKYFSRIGMTLNNKNSYPSYRGGYGIFYSDGTYDVNGDAYLSTMTDVIFLGRDSNYGIKTHNIIRISQIIDTNNNYYEWFVHNEGGRYIHSTTTYANINATYISNGNQNSRINSIELLNIPTNAYGFITLYGLK